MNLVQTPGPDNSLITKPDLPPLNKQLCVRAFVCVRIQEREGERKFTHIHTLGLEPRALCAEHIYVALNP